MPQRRIGKFELLDELGHGGMGVVYRARDTRLDRVVALKLMQSERMLDESSRKRFLRECRAVASLSHPNIATLFEADEAGDGTLYFAAELVEGETLAAQLKRGDSRAPEEIFHYGLQLAAALAAAHDRRIVHRDVKPGNLMITPAGQLKVLDFGLAHLGREHPVVDPAATTAAPSGPEPTGTLTEGRALGTPAYMAPEQIRGEPVLAATDVFAAGIVLYELATGTRPFGVGTLQERLECIQLDQPRAPSALNRRVSRALDRVILRCLNEDPAKRFQNGAELHEALERCRQSTTLRRRWAWGAAVAATTAVVSTGVWWSQQRMLAFSSHDRILIADVVNETSEPVFAGALGTALEADLRQSQYALVVGRREVDEAFQLTRRPPGTTLDVDTALDLARWVRAKAVLAPSIVQVGDTFRLDAALYSVETAGVVDRVTIVADGKDDVLKSAVDKLTSAVRSKLGESLAEIAQSDAPVVVVSTASWDALEALRLATKALRVGKPAEAAPLLEEALRIDPEFAAARGQLGLIFIQYLNQPERGQRLLGEAAASIDRLSSYERAIVKGLAAQFVDRDLPRALAAFEAAALQFPERAEPLQNKGIVLRMLGRYSEAAAAFTDAHERFAESVGPLLPLWFLQTGPLRDPIGAEKTSNELLALSPGNPDYRHMLGWSYLCQRRFDDARRELDSILADHPDHPFAKVNRAHLVLRLGDAAGAVPFYRDLLADTRTGRLRQELPAALFWLATAVDAAGDTAEAGQLLVEAEHAAADPGPKAAPAARQLRAAFRSLVLAARGQKDDALRTLDTLPPSDQLGPGVARVAASAFAWLGDVDRALDLVARGYRQQPFDVYYDLILPDYRPLWADDRFTRLVTTGNPGPS